MTNLGWILIGGFLMSGVAMVGGLTTLLPPAKLARLILPLVAMAAGTLIGGAFFHMIPEGLIKVESPLAGLWIVAGFSTFLLVEQVLHWHHSHQVSEVKTNPVTPLILIGDGAHNFLGGLAIASTFLLDARAGFLAWIAAVAHEIPQELGDFAILVHGGWPKGKALLWNFVSGLTFALGALLAYSFSFHFEVSPLVLFGAGNFIYIAASDLIPEIKSEGNLRRAFTHFGAFLGGLIIMYWLAAGF